MVRPAKEHRLKASPEHQRELLAVQDIDIRLDQLAHKARTLPQLARITEVTNELAELNTALVIATTELSDLNQQIIRAEGDVATVKTRAKRDQDLLDSGSITSGKQLEDLQNEISSLTRRQSELEDAELELMESAEEIQTRVREISEKIEQNQAELGMLETAKTEAMTSITDDESGLRQERLVIASKIPDDLLTLYNKIRDTQGGVGAAPLVGGRCEGCHMQLSPSDLGLINQAEADEVVRCEECRRILVRK